MNNNDLLQKRIIELNEQLHTEREEYKELYRKLKQENELLLVELDEYKNLYIKLKKELDDQLYCSNNEGSI